LPPADADFWTRWKRIKAQFSAGLPPLEPRSASRIAKGECGIWQRRCWEHTVQDDDDWRR
jgi:putative transposase